jgi:hypothetical protein
MSSVAVYEVSLVQEETVFCIYNILCNPSVGVQNMYRINVGRDYFAGLRVTKRNKGNTNQTLTLT